MAVSFAYSIKPYFNPCMRAHMIQLGLDLWDATQVQNNFGSIQSQVESGNMPPKNETGGMQPCGGGWDSYTQQQFLTDFAAWQEGGFQP